MVLGIKIGGTKGIGAKVAPQKETLDYQGLIDAILSGGGGGGGGTPSFSSTEGGMRTQAELDAQAAEAAWQRQLQLEQLRQDNQAKLDATAAALADARQKGDFAQSDKLQKDQQTFTVEQNKLANEQAMLIQSKDFENAYKLKLTDQEFTTQRDLKAAESRAKEFADTQALERERMAASKEEGQADRAASLARAQMEIQAAANRSAAEIKAAANLQGLRIAADRAMQGERIAADTKQLLIQIGATKENTLLGGVRLSLIWRDSQAPMGQDPHGREELTSNYYARSNRPGPHVFE